MFDAPSAIALKISTLLSGFWGCRIWRGIVSSAIAMHGFGIGGGFARGIFKGVMCAGLMLGCGGCALIPVATLGTLAGIAGTAASAGPEVYQLGKLDRAVMASDGDCRFAVRHAAADLRLRIVEDGKKSKCEPKWVFELKDERKSKIEITVERRSAMLCLCRVDVGWFGSEPVARLVMEVIESHLPAAATRPAHAEG